MDRQDKEAAKNGTIPEYQRTGVVDMSGSGSRNAGQNNSNSGQNTNNTSQNSSSGKRN